MTSDGHPVFPAEAGRYHLVASANCPFCHRTTILRALKGLEVMRAGSGRQGTPAADSGASSANLRQASPKQMV